ncbi:replication factor A, partial [Candidatus Woesearchaeota archaeon CG11_big_fil_rev_8_21_14_0_20_57_5]
MQQNYDELVAKVLESGKINQKELDQKVKEKIEKLSGLISKEGAVHIVANELGIRLAPAALASTQLKIANIQQGLR